MHSTGGSIRTRCTSNEQIVACGSDAQGLTKCSVLHGLPRCRTFPFLLTFRRPSAFHSPFTCRISYYWSLATESISSNNCFSDKNSNYVRRRRHFLDVDQVRSPNESFFVCYFTLTALAALTLSSVLRSLNSADLSKSPAVILAGDLPMVCFTIFLANSH